MRDERARWLLCGRADEACARCGAGWVGSGACAHTLGMRGGICRVNIDAALSENKPVL